MSPRSESHRHRNWELVLAAALVGSALVAVIEPSGAAPVASAQTPTTGCVVDLTGMLGWWRGEDTTEAQVGDDLTGNPGYDGGLVGQAMVLGAATDLSTTVLPAVSDALTIEMWIKPTVQEFTGRVQSLASRWDFPSQDDAARSYFLYLDASLNLVFETDELSTRSPEVVRAATTQLDDGEFHHVAATWDLSAITLYVDGAVAATAPSQRGTLNAAASTPFRLGAQGGAGSQFRFDGLIDEPSLWSRALSAAEIAEIVNRSSAGKCDFVPVERAKLTAPTTQANDKFGSSVAVNGTTAVTGAPYSSRLRPFDGSVYVYTRSGPTWTQQARLSPTDPGNVDLNGWAVDVETNTVITGSYGNNAVGSDSGAAYVFFRTGTVWAQQAKLVPADAAAGDGLGYSVAIDGDTAIAAAVGDDGAGADSGSVYVFVRSGSTWTEQAKLVASDGAASDSFGTWVDIDGDTIVVGAAGDNDGAAFNTGAAYIFTRSGTTWTEQAKLVAPVPDADDQFGYGVGVDGNVVVVGAPSADAAGASSGAVHVFRRAGTSWAHEAQLLAVDTTAGDRFGSAVATNGSSIVVGSPRDGAADSQRGSAYVFNRTAPTWTEITKLVPADNDVGDQFGIAVASSGSILVGAHNDDDAGNNSGSAYVFAP
jgi:hypothetical protein